ncbi:hypothetical protein FDUTEX481_09055 [Tolypothrix sp. PCC 7601]|nr:hypothetical protein FDUTEX481_09055 [Tolypothrix sp. PCC 7601]UYD37129.1 hypothetical protein HG267_16210 [Tolypothrix sp. PCC 7601]
MGIGDWVIALFMKRYYEFVILKACHYLQFSYQFKKRMRQIVGARHCLAL